MVDRVICDRGAAEVVLEVDVPAVEAAVGCLEVPERPRFAAVARHDARPGRASPRARELALWHSDLSAGLVGGI